MPIYQSKEVPEDEEGKRSLVMMNDTKEAMICDSALGEGRFLQGQVIIPRNDSQYTIIENRGDNLREKVRVLQYRNLSTFMVRIE